MPQPLPPDAPAPNRLTQVIVAALLAFLVWRLSDVILMAFGAVLIGVLLHALAEPLQKRLRLSRPLALTVAVAAVVLAVSGSVWLFGQQLALQVASLGEILPRAWAALEQRLAASAGGVQLLEELRRLRLDNTSVVSWGSRLVQGTAEALVTGVIVTFAGLYVAFHPRTYAEGALRLVPPRFRGRAREVAGECVTALNRWLVGQLISMALVAVTVAAGLTLAGIPSALALGVVAGLGQLVPVLGPMVSMIPGLIVASALGLQPLAWTTVVYVGAMQFEANVITPLVLRSMVEVPMAVTLFAVLAMGLLFGGLGVLFATPLVVVGYVIVRRVYLEDVLHEAPEPPPETQA
jgi:predicted PurR-regulated permease PerM